MGMSIRRCCISVQQARADCELQAPGIGCYLAVSSLTSEECLMRCRSAKAYTQRNPEGLMAWELCVCSCIAFQLLHTS